MEHIQKDFEGSSIQQWELDHGITRVVKDECEYVVCTNFQRFVQQCEEEKRRERQEYIAAQQAEAYLGGEAR